MMKKILITPLILIGIAIVTLIGIVLLIPTGGQPNNTLSSISINNHVIYVELADTKIKQILGLSYRQSLATTTGMLFTFPDKQIRSFWMKDMNFPLDILWLADNQIVGIEKNLFPQGDIPSKNYSSPQPVNYVLEVNAGTADEYDIKPGNMVIYN